MAGRDIKEMYEEYFDPKAYCALYYGSPDPEVEFFLKMYYQMFKEETILQEMPKPRTILDLGCGPVPIYAATAVAASFTTKVTMAEMLQKNREALFRWLKNQETEINWNFYFEIIQTISGKGSLAIEQLLRESIYDITTIDLHQEPKAYCLQYSAVMTTLCLEFVASSISEYGLMVARVSRYIKVGGILMMAGALGNSYYMLSGTKFPSLIIQEADIKVALEAANLKIFFMKTLGRHSDQEMKPADHSGVFFVAAQKLKN